MARKSSTTDSSASQVTKAAKEVGYVLGKMEMLEKKFDEHREESKQEKELILAKLEQMSNNMSFWKHGLWIIKALVLSLPLILAGNTQGLMELWKSF
jgi:hypothetical protein